MNKVQYLAIGLLAALLAPLLIGALHAETQQLQNRSLIISDSRAAVTAQYKFSFQLPDLGTMQNIVFQICSNNPIAGDPCMAPVGLDASNAALVSQSGDQGFVRSAQSTANKIVLSRPPLASDGQQDTYELAGIINPASNSTNYVRVLVFPDNNTETGYNYQGGLVYYINRSVSIQATVPPFLLFCAGVSVIGYDCDTVTGDYVDFGEFSSRQASQGTTQMLAASNARDGYTIRVLGSTLTSGNNIIPALTSNDASRPGISQFGMNLRANSAPRGGTEASGLGYGGAANGYNEPNRYRFNSGEVVARTTRPDEARRYTASYVVNVQKDQAPGIYVSTLTYVALGNY